jgi:hypothetical protein
MKNIGKKKIGKLLEERSFRTRQLSLFQTFLCNDDIERGRLSNTIDLWDGIPKYFVSRQDMNNRRNPEGYLPSLEKTFDYRGRAFHVKIIPARITDYDGKDKELYPSAREELVEDALRKIAAEQRYGFSDSHDTGVMFTLHILRRELQKRGHTMSYQQVRESLEVMAGTLIEITSENGKGICKAPILAGLAAVSREQYREDPTARWVAYFNPLVNRSIHELSYRQYDYHRMMSHRSQLARWLHKRLSHNYVQASYMNPYEILFSSVKRDSGLLNYARKRDEVAQFDAALNELKSSGVILSYEKEERRSERNKILDVKYILMPAPGFISDVKTANKRLALAEQSLKEPTR